MRISTRLFALARVLQARHLEDLLWDSRVLRRAEAGTRFLWMSYPSGSHMMELCPRENQNRCSRLLRSWWSCFASHQRHMLYEIQVCWMDGGKAMGDVRPITWPRAYRLAVQAQETPDSGWEVLVAA